MVTVEVYLKGNNWTKFTMENVLEQSIREEDGFLRYEYDGDDQHESVNMRLDNISHYMVIHKK